MQNYIDFHGGGDGAGENPPNQALRRALRIRMSSIPPASYIVSFFLMYTNLGIFWQILHLIMGSTFNYRILHLMMGFTFNYDDSKPL